MRMLWVKDEEVNWKEMLDRETEVVEVMRMDSREVSSREERFFMGMLVVSLPDMVIVSLPLNDVDTHSAE